MKRVLVTGGAGFIGSHIVDELVKQNFHVVVLDNLSTGKVENVRHRHIEVHQWDITDPNVVEMITSLCPDYIIHQAAQVSVAESVKNPVHDEHINIKGSLHVIEAAVKARVKKLVFASSAAVYGNPLSLPISIHHPTRPTSPYGLTKLTVENYLKLNSQLNQLPYSILRYSNVYGPRQDANGEGGVVAIFTDKLINQVAPVIFGDGEQTRDFVYVKDVAKANVKAMLAEQNLCVNISSGTSITINQLFEAMRKVAHSHVQVIYRPERLGDIRDSLLNNDEAKTEINWEPVYDLHEGLQETFHHAAKVKNHTFDMVSNQ
ncbi:NAD-dependent epimerase/dehydratase family protein [Mesobacillus maritimus]|uniref:NAD-dependent epimerase/dehydratase family protein n=1 Tax=Mesobacillus maritimus TaxID=1643336 RepID=UPI002040F277|nr:NAD-dependent epimerase/dehydratase family protein [Mesobacillus maritimus]MCM3585254.1 NAD-dependent epimerase/dehydratase family protein [Mesobacillus maritimus]